MTCEETLTIAPRIFSSIIFLANIWLTLITCFTLALNNLQILTNIDTWPLKVCFFLLSAYKT
jgi:hypothetical protein